MSGGPVSVWILGDQLLAQRPALLADVYSVSQSTQNLQKIYKFSQRSWQFRGDCQAESPTTPHVRLPDNRLHRTQIRMPSRWHSDTVSRYHREPFAGSLYIVRDQVRQRMAWAIRCAELGTASTEDDMEPGFRDLARRCPLAYTVSCQRT
jgi:hypothetical protein